MVPKRMMIMMMVLVVMAMVMLVVMVMMMVVGMATRYRTHGKCARPTPKVNRTLATSRQDPGQQ